MDWTTDFVNNCSLWLQLGCSWSCKAISEMSAPWRFFSFSQPKKLLHISGGCFFESPKSNECRPWNIRAIFRLTSFPSLRSGPCLQQDHSSFVRFLSNVFFPRPFRDLHSLSANACVTSVFPVVPSAREVPEPWIRLEFEVGSRWSFHQGTKLGSGGKGPLGIFDEKWTFVVVCRFFSFLEGGRIFFFGFFSRNWQQESPPFFFFPFWWITPWPMCFIGVSIRFNLPLVTFRRV